MHVDSHYAAQFAPDAQFDALNGLLNTRTCVIGAGFAGLTTARELAKRGHEVVVLEAELVGWGASGRNGGFVAAGFARSAPSIAAAIGWPDTKRLFRLSEQGRDCVHQSIGELGLEEIISGNGWLRVLRHKNVDELLKYRDEMGERLGVELDYIKAAELDNYVKSERYFAGLNDRHSFHIQPLAYARALAQDIRRLGGDIFENTKCIGIKKSGSLQNGQSGNWLVKTAHGSVSAENVVLATSSYGGPWGKLNSAIIPVATYVVSTAPCGQILDDNIPYSGCIGDTRRAGDYYRTIGNGAEGSKDERRLIWGGRITTMSSNPQRLAQMLRADIIRIYPQLAELKIERAWSGLMGYARHQMPIIGELDDGLWAATAFGGHGLNTTAMAGLLISAAINNGSEEFRRFEPFGPVSAGGILGRMAAQTEYWRLQFLDWRDEVRNTKNTG